MTNVHEALKEAIAALNSGVLKDHAVRLCKAALADIEKCEPVGYVDRITLERWQLLKGTEYESAERGYIGFSKEPFKTKLTDCTLAVFTSPQPREGWVSVPDIESLAKEHDVYEVGDYGNTYPISLERLENFANAYHKAMISAAPKE